MKQKRVMQVMESWKNCLREQQRQTKRLLLSIVIQMRIRQSNKNFLKEVYCSDLQLRDAVKRQLLLKTHQ